MSVNVTAASSGEVSLGGKISVHRLGYGAMRLTGNGIWGPLRIERKHLEYCGGRLSWE